MRRMLLAAAYVASVAVAYALGAARRSPEAPAEDVPRPLAQAERTPPSPRSHAEADVPPRLQGSGSPGDLAVERSRGIPPEVHRAFPHPKNAALVAEIDALLRSGPRGHLELLRLFGRAQAGAGPEWIWPRPTEPAAGTRRLWLAHLNDEEHLVHAFIEGVLRLLEDSPDEVAALEYGVELEAFEDFFGTLAHRMPRARFERVREKLTALYARRNDLPEPVAEFVDHTAGEWLGRWAATASVEEALRRLARPDLHPDERAALLDRLPDDRWTEVDVPTQVARLVEGDRWTGALDAGGRDDGSIRWSTWEDALVDAIARNRAGRVHARRFLEVAGWTAWPDARHLVEGCLAKGRHAGMVAALLVHDLDEGPPLAEVNAWRARRDLDPVVRRVLAQSVGR